MTTTIRTTRELDERCYRAESTRDCNRNHEWNGVGAWHFHNVTAADGTPTGSCLHAHIAWVETSVRVKMSVRVIRCTSCDKRWTAR